MTCCIGIDLGTSTICSSIVHKGEPVIIPSPDNSRVVPSYVYLREDGRFLIGEAAKAEVIADPYNTVWATKRLLGRNFSDAHVKSCVKNLTYNIVEGDGGKVMIQSRGKKFTPEWVASLLLNFVITNSSKYLNTKVTHAVITVPGTFSKTQREATQKAAEKIGIKVVRLLSEPTAAAISWGFHKEAGQTIGVFDLGGGTLDIFIMKIAEGQYKLLSAAGDPWLGGEDFDNALVHHIAKDMNKRFKINIYSDKMAHQRVKTAAEKAKLELSEAEETRIYVPTIAPDINRMADVNMTVTREQFNGLVEGLADRATDIFRKALKDADLGVDDLDNVIMVGGMTRMPLVREKLFKLMGRSPDTSINPDEAVARGAAITAAGMSGQKVVLEPPASTKPGLEYLSGDVDIEAMYAEAIQSKNEEQDEQPLYDPRQGFVGSQQQQMNQSAPPPANYEQNLMQPLQTPGPYPQAGPPQQETPPAQPATSPSQPAAKAVSSSANENSAQEEDELPPLPEDALLPLPDSSDPAADDEESRPQASHEQSTHLSLQVVSNTVQELDVSRIFPANKEDKFTKGGFAIGAGRKEGFRIKLYQNGGDAENKTLLGEFYVQGAAENGSASPKLKIVFNVNNSVSFSVDKP
ncbi:MAG: Hsp70 family protein [bacterium]